MKIQSVEILVLRFDVHHHVPFFPSHSSHIPPIYFLFILLFVAHVLSSNHTLRASIRVFFIRVVVVGIVLIVRVRIISISVLFFHLFILEVEVSEKVLLSDFNLWTGRIEANFFSNEGVVVLVIFTNIKLSKFNQKYSYSTCLPPSSTTPLIEPPFIKLSTFTTLILLLDSCSSLAC